MHLTPHPQAGKYFRINIDNGNSPAGYDQMLHGGLFQLLDWADRIANETNFTARQKEVALTFFAHRCQPDICGFSDPIPQSSLNLDGCVYGSCTIEYEGRSREKIIVIREFELIEP
jgi:hypothetical protein